MTIEANLGLTDLAQNQAQPHITLNANSRILGAVVQLVCLSVSTSSPPGSPTEGDVYVLSGSAPSGLWAGHEEDVAYWDGTSWIFVSPQQGWLAYDIGTSTTYRFVSQSAGWVAVTYDMPYVVGGFLGTIGASAVCIDHIFPVAVDFPDDFAGSDADELTNATVGSAVFDVTKNGSSIGSVTFTTGGNQTFATTGGATSFAAGDRLRVIAPGTPNATLADITISLLGTYALPSV